MTEERILITVKTYPTLSKKYLETVCTAGINEAGEWRRLYPIRFRYLEEEKQYHVYDRISVKLDEVPKDGRPETRRPQAETLSVLDNISKWAHRDEWIRPTIHSSMRSLLSAKQTIGAVQVSQVKELTFTQIGSEWSASQKEQLRQEGLWSKKEPKPLEKIPYQFHLVWRDGDGSEHRNMFISWEVCQTYRSYRRMYDKPLEVLAEKWMNDLFGPNREVAFFMGNSARFRQNYMVCGTYTPAKKEINRDTLFS